MALRVLLADESTTIKKVMQLALQDFAVEVKSVHSGVDVVEVAKAFAPDIIFADVLLQKKNGYEVCADLRKDGALKKMPLVLMWSSFMDLDEKLAAASGADRRLEKPFDVENLRQLILELVPKTRTQRLAQFLQYPEQIAQPLKDEVAAKAPKTPPAPPARPAVEPVPETQARPATSATAPPSAWTMESFADINEFAEAQTAPAQEPQSPGLALEPDGDDEPFSELRIMAPTSHADEIEEQTQTPAVAARETPAGDDSEPWSHQDLSRFKLDLNSLSDGAEDAIELPLELPEAETIAREMPPNFVRGPDRATQAALGREPTGTAAPDAEYRAMNFDDSQAPMEHLQEIQIDSDGAPTGLSLDDAPLNFDLADPNAFNEEDLRTARGGERTESREAIPQLSADRLEAIVRAQSREIIEGLVRKLVPELASQIIRAELERLLEDERSTAERPR